MKDTRTVLDNVRAKIPSGAKLLCVYIDNNGMLRCSQANCSQSDLSQIVASLQMNMMSEKVGKRG